MTTKKKMKTMTSRISLMPVLSSFFYQSRLFPREGLQLRYACCHNVDDVIQTSNFIVTVELKMRACVLGNELEKMRFGIKSEQSARVLLILISSARTYHLLRYTIRDVVLPMESKYAAVRGRLNRARIFKSDATRQCSWPTLSFIRNGFFYNHFQRVIARLEELPKIEIGGGIDLLPYRIVLNSCRQN
jgi:hypothetical protein